MSLTLQQIRDEIKKVSGVNQLNYLSDNVSNARTNDLSGWNSSGGGMSVAFTDSVSEVLRNGGSWKLSASSATPGDWQEIPFVLPEADANKLCSMSFDLKGLVGVNDYNNGDFSLEVVKDPGGSETVITPNISNIPKKGPFVAVWTSGDAGSYSLRFKTNVANSDGISIDLITIGPGDIIFGIQSSEWEDFTPVFKEGDDTGTAVTLQAGAVAKWARVAGSMLLTVRCRFSALPAATVYMNLPNNVKPMSMGGTVDSNVGSWGTFNEVRHGYINVATDEKGLRFNDQTQSGSYLSYNDYGSTTRTLTFNAIVPIADWAGSSNFGTNEVEYLFNSSTDDTDNTVNSEKGIRGGLIPQSALSATRSKRVTTVRNLTDKDQIQLEVSIAGEALWHDSRDIFPQITDGANEYGMWWERVDSNSIDVKFGGSGALSDGTQWSNLSLADYRWRLIVHSPGHAVAFGIADENISGLISNTTQTIGGKKTFADGIAGPGSVPVGSIIAVAANLTGVIIPSSGVISSDGFMLCDGSAIPAESPLTGQNTPTLSDGRFLRGSITAGATGGSDTYDLRHAHNTTTAVSVGGHTLAICHLPSHSHSISHDHAGTCTDVGGAHGHGFYGYCGGTFVGAGVYFGIGDLTGTTLNTHVYADPAATSTIKYSQTTGQRGGDYVCLQNHPGHQHCIDLPLYSGNSGNAGSGCTFNHSVTNNTVASSLELSTTQTVIPKYLTTVYLIRVK